MSDDVLTPEALPPLPVLRSSPEKRTVEGWALVLDALGIENLVDEREGRFTLSVGPGDEDRARAALAAHDREAHEEAQAAAVIPAPVDQGPSVAGVAAVLVLVGFYVVAGGRDDGGSADLFRRGTAVADKIVRGELWRTVTALTLHADLAHILGNAVAAFVFLSALGRQLGTGLALFLTLLAGAAGNWAVAAVYRHGHNSVGASTATFAALGLLGGLQFLRWSRVPKGVSRARRRARTVAAACLALFALLGVGERSDVLAHVTGLGFGFAFGVVAGRLVRGRTPMVLQALFTLLAAGGVLLAWGAALR